MNPLRTCRYSSAKTHDFPSVQILRRLYTLLVDETQRIDIRDLYPHLSEEQLKEAEENLMRYLAAMVRIYERDQGISPVAKATQHDHQLTDPKGSPTLTQEAERS